MKKQSNKPAVTRDMPSRGEGVKTTYTFAKLGGISVQASTHAEAQVKAEAKFKALNSKSKRIKNN